MIKRMLVALLLLPAAVFAHPGHDGLSSAVHPDKHILSGAESILIFTSIVLLAATVIWFAKRR